MNWLLLHYLPTTLFSLKSCVATSSVGRSLIVPTPYAVKMAFVDSAFRYGLPTEICEGLVEKLAEVEVRIKPAGNSIVNQTIQKIRQEERNDRESDQIYISSIAYRELVYLDSCWIWAFNVREDTELSSLLLKLAPAINYVGKRGSMIQFMGSETRDELDNRFTMPIAEIQGVRLPERTHIALLDDFGPKANFNCLNSFDPKARVDLGKHRLRISTLIPSGVIDAGSGFVHYST